MTWCPHYRQGFQGEPLPCAFPRCFASVGDRILYVVERPRLTVGAISAVVLGAPPPLSLCRFERIHLQRFQPPSAEAIRRARLQRRPPPDPKLVCDVWAWKRLE